MKNLRMYCLVLYNISPIQQGIQAAHAIAEYSLLWNTPNYREWAEDHKTIIILNGGTSTSPSNAGKFYNTGLGSMEIHLQTLRELFYDCAPFYEPDLNYALTAISFVVDMNNMDPTFEAWLKTFKLA
jgi:hypothetical protein